MATVAADNIVDKLRDEIISGRLTEGTPLREVTLSKRFKVGRSSIREALQQLAHEGIVVTRPNVGARVAAPAPDGIAELLVPLRQTLELYALRAIFPQINGDDIQRWETILEEMRAACEKRDYARLAEVDISFHRSIVERAAQPDLTTIWRTLVSRFRRHLLEGYRGADDLMKIYYEHAAIVFAIRSGNLEAAAKTLEQFIE